MGTEDGRSPSDPIPSAAGYVEVWEPMLFERPVGRDLEEWRQNVCKSELYQRGDTVLVWVNEGDLYSNPSVKRLLKPEEAVAASETPNLSPQGHSHD